MHLISDTNVHLENKRVSRMFFAFLWLLYVLVYMTKNCFSGALSQIVEDGALTLTQASWINAAFYFVYAPLQILGGIFADKYSPEKLITIGLLGGGVANVIIFFNQSFTVILITWIFNAIIQFGLWPSVFKVMSSQLVRSDRGNMVFFMSFANPAGLVLCYAVSAFLPRWELNFAISSIVLFLLAIALLIICRYVDPILKKDKNDEAPDLKVNAEAPSHNKWHIFLISGFYMIIATTLFRSMLEYSVKLFSSTMLNQSYEQLDPTLSNLLSVLILGSGMVGTFLVKKLIFPRLIKNEILCYALILAIAIPFVVFLRFIGIVPVWSIVVSLCAINTLMCATLLLASFFNMRFTKYGLNGTAAGIINSAASLGVALQHCLFGTIADNIGWPAVTVILIALAIASTLCIFIALRPATKFIKSVEDAK